MERSDVKESLAGLRKYKTQDILKLQFDEKLAINAVGNLTHCSQSTLFNKSGASGIFLFIAEAQES